MGLFAEQYLGGGGVVYWIILEEWVGLLTGKLETKIEIKFSFMYFILASWG